MKNILMFIVPLCLFADVAHCADDDEVRFKPQHYKSRNKESAPTRKYAEKPFAVSEKAAARSTGTTFTPAKDKKLPEMKPLEMKPLVSKEAEDTKLLDPPPPMKDNPYKPGDDLIHPSTISSNQTLLAEQKRFVVGTNKTAATKEFIPAEKPKEKNPLLKPRQGIKEIPVDDNP